jgi:hypothetical protein
MNALATSLRFTTEKILKKRNAANGPSVGALAASLANYNARPAIDNDLLRFGASRGNTSGSSEIRLVSILKEKNPWNMLALPMVRPTQLGILLFSLIRSALAEPNQIAVRIGIYEFVDGSNEVLAISPAAVSIGSSFPNGRIYYTTDGSEPTFLNGTEFILHAFSVTNATQIKIKAYSADLSQIAQREILVKIVPPITFRVTGLPYPEVKIPANQFAENVSQRNIFTVPSNTVVQIRADHRAPWQFKEWRGLTNSFELSLSLRIDRGGDLEAVYQTDFSANVQGLGRIVLDPPPSYEYNQTFQVSAIPDAGHVFVGWDRANREKSISHHRSALDPLGNTLQAQFAPLPEGFHALTLVGEGNITMPKLEKYAYSNGTSVTIQPIIGVEHQFVGWSGDTSGTEPGITVMLDRSKTLIGRTKSIWTDRLRLTLNQETVTLRFLPSSSGPLRLQSSTDLRTWADFHSFTNAVELLLPASESRQYFRVSE